MSNSLLEVCDQYIVRCRDVLDAKDAAAAKKLRAEATLIFHTIVPRWSAGLMAAITHFYLDDIESILGKLTEFRRRLETEGDREFDSADRQTVMPSRPNHNRTRRTRLDSFEQTCRWIRDCYTVGVSEKNDILARISDLQRIAAGATPASQKWLELEGHLEWIKSADVEVAVRVLPLLTEILQN
jgi:hypothetical protein